jgi:hypothetical protein
MMKRREKRISHIEQGISNDEVEKQGWAYLASAGWVTQREFPMTYGAKSTQWRG